jgi:hypothetical protein
MLVRLEIVLDRPCYIEQVGEADCGNLVPFEHRPDILTQFGTICFVHATAINPNEFQILLRGL